jgi:aldose 1-epimerase
MFRINKVSKGADWETVQLIDEKSGIMAGIVPHAGAILNELVVNGIDIVDGYQDAGDFVSRVHQGFRSAKLSPFVCRLHHASYSWLGKQYRLDKFMLNDAALHGILYDVKFDIISEKQGTEQASVVLRYQYNGSHPGYPFPFNCTVTYMLEKEGRLTIATHVSNPSTADGPIPIVDGWHPYFRLGGKVDDWWLQIASDQMIEYDDQLIPTGAYIEHTVFSEGRLIGDMVLDNGFLLKEDISPIAILKNPSNGLCMQCISQVNYPFLQLYIPDNRESIAIENLSGAPDAFNNGIGLSILAPGEKKDFVVTLQMSWAIP